MAASISRRPLLAYLIEYNRIQKNETAESAGSAWSALEPSKTAGIYHKTNHRLARCFIF